jgi:hypothetical protein
MPETENLNTPQEANRDSGSKKPEIDLQALAERIFKLMKEEALIQQERQAASSLKRLKGPYGR